ncbi:MAG: MBL fold metallo-hydrolase [Chloroflexi bacterium]|nr:MAG: MBL fold metallo-hydrolase [Chloroflexota bacterium]TMG70399.1 MAG: MBL fold metallo-hydrolase [Chloroflexota bacterium]
MKIAEGIHRIGGGVVNSYLVEERGEITIVDTGAPGHWRELQQELAAMGRSLANVRAVALTHAHVDHVGFAERIRRERSVPVKVHEADAKMARGEERPRNQRMLGVSPFGLLRFIVYALAHGMLRSTPISEVATFGDGATLDIPGAPRVIHVPGHSPGSAVLHISSRDALFVGDALCTMNVLTGKRGPQLTPFGSDFPQAVASLARLEHVEAGLVLPGHGEPWTGGVGEAVRRVRESAPH